MDAQPIPRVQILSFHFLYIYKILFQTKWQNRYNFWDLVAPTFIVPFGMLPNSLYKYLSRDTCIYVFLFVDLGSKTNNKSVHMYILRNRAILNLLMNTLYFLLDVST